MPKDRPTGDWGHSKSPEEPWINIVLKGPLAVFAMFVLFILIGVPWAYGVGGLLAQILKRL